MATVPVVLVVVDVPELNAIEDAVERLEVSVEDGKVVEMVDVLNAVSNVPSDKR